MHNIKEFYWNCKSTMGFYLIPGKGGAQNKDLGAGS